MKMERIFTDIFAENDLMRHKLKWLTVIAGISLLSMVGLQIFWLRAAYKEQERTFLADAENTLFSVLLDESLNKVTGKDSLMAAAFRELTASGIIQTKEGNGPGGFGQGNMRINIVIPDSVAVDTSRLSQLLAEIKNRKGRGDTLLRIMTDSSEDVDEHFFAGLNEMSAIQSHFIRAIKKKGYDVYAEIAALDSAGHILEATCDSQLFRQISVKTSPDWLKNAAKNESQHIQIAFPGITMVLLQRMGAILIISSLLIIFCLSSVTYLLVLFFRQKRISEIRNDFMNNMTHELKTPISSVSVAIELMNDASVHNDPARVSDYMQIAQGELNRLTMLVEKVLKIAAFEKSDINIRKESFLAVSWLQQIAHSFKPIFETGSVLFSMQVKPELLMMNADKTHMTNVLHNLIDNALKYNNKQKPVIDVIIQDTDNQIYIMVKDNGKGISNSDQQKVFDKFYRVPQGDQHNVKGYGLGLSYVKEIVRLHLGEVRIESVLGQGSTFIITLPK